jgi:small subunit ribosomal protein S30
VFLTSLSVFLFFKFVPLDYSIPTEIPVMKCKPDKLPLFRRQYENSIFTGKFLFTF